MRTVKVESSCYRPVMSQKPEIKSVDPLYAITGGEISIECSGFDAADRDGGCYFGAQKANIIAASRKRLLVKVPESSAGKVPLRIECGGIASDEIDINIGRLIADEMHFVGNPAVDPNDDTIIMTRSGGRGQELPATLFRLADESFWNEMTAIVMNPTGLAFDKNGDLFVTNRAAGEVYRIHEDGEADLFASGLGIATGIAFDKDGTLFVGDRSGTIFRVGEFGIAEPFADVEPSVAAYHIAFGLDNKLYVSSPGLASSDVIYAVDDGGAVERYAKGFGRPQGLAFDADGNLYAAACLGGRHGIVRVDPQTREAKTIVAGNNIVGLCFTRSGELVAATSNSLYSIPINVQGSLLS